MVGKRPFFSILLILLALIMCRTGEVQAQGHWPTTDINGVEYVRLSDVWRFYGFQPRKGRTGFVSYGAANRTVSVRAARQDFYVNNFRYVLSYPVIEKDGRMLISSTDMKKLVDPVLRPQYSQKAGVLRTIVIDAGHGGHDAGAVSPYAREKDCNLAVAKKLKLRLQKLGYRVIMTRDADYFLTLQQRVQIANRVPDSIFVSIHHNSGRRAANGIETFTLAPHGTTSPFARSRRTEDLAGNNQDSENIALATAVHSHAIRSTRAEDRGIQRARFSVLCTIRRPAILFEGGFVSNPEEGRLISTSKYQDKLAESICKGIVAYNNTVCRRNAKPANNLRKKGYVRTSIPGSSIGTVLKQKGRASK